MGFQHRTGVRGEVGLDGNFVREEVEPLDHLTHQDEFAVYAPLSPELAAIVRPLQDRVREQGLWACHLGPELGGQGFGQVKLALINEILGRTAWGPIVFGCQAPDTGNAEILAMFGTDEQKQRYLRPLLNGEIFSAFSMTEPLGGADPRLFETTAELDGDDWIISGDKYFTSNAQNAAFFIIMAVTEPSAPPRESMSMFLVPAETPGIPVRHSRDLPRSTLTRLGWKCVESPSLSARMSAIQLVGDVAMHHQGILRGLGQTVNCLTRSHRPCSGKGASGVGRSVQNSCTTASTRRLPGAKSAEGDARSAGRRRLLRSGWEDAEASNRS